MQINNQNKQLLCFVFSSKLKEVLICCPYDSKVCVSRRKSIFARLHIWKVGFRRYWIFGLIAYLNGSSYNQDDHYFRTPSSPTVEAIIWKSLKMRIVDWRRPARRMRFIRSKTNIIITICKHCNHNPGIGSAYLSLIRIWICAIFGSGFPRELAAVPRLSSEMFDERGSECVNTGAPLPPIIVLMTILMTIVYKLLNWRSSQHLRLITTINSFAPLPFSAPKDSTLLTLWQNPSHEQCAMHTDLFALHAD